jgi:hypothetical protein
VVVDSSIAGSRGLRGVRHPPQADIQAIRQLLEGYDSATGILKELIQNAEDACASRMEIVLIPGEKASPISLLRNPGLIVANDGEFNEANLSAIFQISLEQKELSSAPSGVSARD